MEGIEGIYINNQKEHLSSVVTPQRLPGRIMMSLTDTRTQPRSRNRPARREVVRFRTGRRGGPPRIADRHHSYLQSFRSLLTRGTISSAVRFGPDANLRGISAGGQHLMCAPHTRYQDSHGFTILLECLALGRDALHQV